MRLRNDADVGLRFLPLAEDLLGRKLIGPSVVSASKSGAVSPILSIAPPINASVAAAVIASSSLRWWARTGSTHGGVADDWLPQLGRDVDATRKKNWRLDGTDPNRQRDWPDDSNTESTPVPRGRGRSTDTRATEASPLPRRSADASGKRGAFTARRPRKSSEFEGDT